MLYRLLAPFADSFIVFNIFRYITFRTAAAAITAFLISVIAGPLIIRKLKEMKAHEDMMKLDSPQLYELQKGKAQTPTMGGLLMLVAIVGSTLLWADIFCIYVVLALAVVTCLGMIGIADDITKLKGRRKGLSIRSKLIMQIVLGAGVGFVLWNVLKAYDWGTFLQFPFLKQLTFALGPWYLLFSLVVLVGSSNAVNLTDGLDGLAVGCTAMVSLAFMVVAYIVGRTDASGYLWITHVPGSGELTVFCAALTGACVGFLWFNCHPADIFMGDTGSLPLGGALGYVALVTKHEMLLVLVGGVFVMEALSVLIQICSFRMWGRRVFAIAPIHHHFQFKGWNENRVTVRFWIIGAILAIVGLCTLKLR